MTIKTKPDCLINHVEVSTHIKCLIVSIAGKNILYEFKDASNMIEDLKVFIHNDDIIRVKQYLEANCSKVKFDKPKQEPDQLSLF